jgi:predicted metal-dependent hydrolase
MSLKKIHLAGIGAVTLYKRRGNRNLRLRIDHDGQVRVTQPYWLPYKVGEQFAVSKSQWIAAQRGQQAIVPLGQGHMVGKHRLIFVASAQATKVTTRLVDYEVRITHPHTYTATDPTVQLAAQKASLRALRREAVAVLPPRLKELSLKTGLAYTNVTIKQLKSRWGSCSSRQEITLNLFLVQLPPHLIDYVLVHELTHTKVMQHGAPFWEEMERHLPEAKRLRKYMRAYQPALKAEQL